jgi:hypothetical protein
LHATGADSPNPPVDLLPPPPPHTHVHIHAHARAPRCRCANPGPGAWWNVTNDPYASEAADSGATGAGKIADATEDGIDGGVESPLWVRCSFLTEIHTRE